MKKNKGNDCFKKDIIDYLTKAQLKRVWFESEFEIDTPGTKSSRKAVLINRIERIANLIGEE
jgi:hypothetical protein